VTVLRAGSATDPGRVRAVNQDSVLITDTLFCVADGMGGHAGGEVASKACVDTLRMEALVAADADAMVVGIKRANEEVIRRSLEDPELGGMGTTVVAAMLVRDVLGDHMVIANVGDSRAYHYQGAGLRQVTNDHSVSAELMRAGEITAEEAAHHGQRHVITRVLGMNDFEVDLFDLELFDGDRILLCSDGLSNEVSDEEIALVLGNIEDPNAAAADLVRRANANGGQDNISVVIVDISQTGRGSAAIPEPLPSAPVMAESAPAAKVVVPRPTEVDDVTSKGDEGWLARRRRLGVRRAITLRTGLLVGAIALVLVGAIGFVWWYEQSSYYVTTKGDSLVIYQGRPGGLLWFHPSLSEVTPTTTKDVLAIRLPQLEAGVIEPSKQAANAYINNLVEEHKAAASLNPTTTTTTVPGAPTTSTTLQAG
jgi:PPM family protein phosphatase